MTRRLFSRSRMILWVCIRLRTSDLGDKLNTVDMIKRVVKPEDFFISKLDIDYHQLPTAYLGLDSIATVYLAEPWGIYMAIRMTTVNQEVWSWDEYQD